MRRPGSYLLAARWHLESLPWSRPYPPRRLKDLPTGFRGRTRSIALTFDDGPDPEVTPQVLDVLAEHGITATFFVCGLAVDRHPDLLRAIAAAGHTVGGHTWHHVDVRGLSDAAWHDEVARTHDRVETLIGRPVRYFRPPWGHLDRVALDRLAARGVTPMLYSVIARDWDVDDPDLVVASVVRDLQPGAIVLMHDACGDLLNPSIEVPAGVVTHRSATVAALPRILERARSDGYGFVALPA
jgi:peptidoglycan-N-acetylglucosamine deacetylase